MEKKVYISLVVISILFIGCGGDDNNKSVAINSIEKSIKKKTTTVGCKKGASNRVCSQKNHYYHPPQDSAEFILNVLAREKESKKATKDIRDIKRDLNSSLEIISIEEKKKSKLEESLISLVDKVDKSKNIKKKRLEDFINSIDREQDSSLGRISIIKEKLNNLVKLNGRESKLKNIKKELENLIEDVTESQKSLSQTEKSIKKLVERAEKENSSSVNRFANAIIRDIKDKKIAIIEENSKYFIIRVQKGDNLSILAKRYYNDKKKYRLIYEANRDKINSDYEIFPNTKLVIPKI